MYCSINNVSIYNDIGRVTTQHTHSMSNYGKSFPEANDTCWTTDRYRRGNVHIKTTKGQNYLTLSNWTENQGQPISPEYFDTVHSVLHWVVSCTSNVWWSKELEKYLGALLKFEATFFYSVSPLFDSAANYLNLNPAFMNRIIFSC